MGLSDDARVHALVPGCSTSPPTLLTGWLANVRARLGVTQAAPARYALAEARLYKTLPAAMPF